ncbi:MAG: hypothetical protein R3F29_02175 [Planctomycetota bacterium]
MSPLCVLSTMLLCVASLLAQRDPQQRDQEALLRQQRALQSNRAEIERLVDLRMRHDLGLPKDQEDEVFSRRVDASATSIDEMQRRLREEDAVTNQTRQRFEALRREVEQLRAAAEARLQEEERDRTFVTMPTSGSRIGFGEPDSSIPMPTQPNVAPPSAPQGESRPAPQISDADLLGLDPVQAQIHGSEDHMRVAQALFKAGQVLLDRGESARERGSVDLGRELDERARERLQRAIDELQPLLELKEPPFVALFYLGRCRELLFRYGERHEGLSLNKNPTEYQQREQQVREPFLQITARDVTKAGDRGQAQVLGAWGEAAQAAVEHFRWMNLRGGYDVRAKIESLTWPGEGER